VNQKRKKKRRKGLGLTLDRSFSSTSYSKKEAGRQSLPSLRVMVWKEGKAFCGLYDRQKPGKKPVMLLEKKKWEEEVGRRSGRSGRSKWMMELLFGNCFEN
jgi:hypothetical protein